LARKILQKININLPARWMAGAFGPFQDRADGLICHYSRPMPSVYIKTYGCQMNERDSEAVAAQLVAKGYTLAPSEAVADVILLNTCSVRDFAEQKALNKMVNVIAETRRNRPETVLGFMGCMAQNRGQELIDRLPDVDLVLGTQKFHRAADYLDELLAGRRNKIVDVAAEQGSEATIREHLLYGNAAKNGDGRRLPLQVTAFVSIMQGCNQYCTFCIVPYTRGEERSRSIPDIVAECRQLVSQGVKEITLLGQIVTSYGKRRFGVVAGVPPAVEPGVPPGGWTPNSSNRLEISYIVPGGKMPPSTAGGTPAATSPFVQLLDAVHEIEGLERIRFTSPHPKGYGDDLIEAYARLPKLVESAHLPVQSGSDRVLKLMHRGYTRARYVGIIDKLRRARPEIGISTDIIVGFPGETEDDFQRTLSLAREIEFDQAYIFKYSQRRDTPAAEMPDQVPQKIREERNQRLLDVINKIAGRRYGAFMGRQTQILVEGPSKKNPARMTGRTRCNKIVVFDPAGGENRGQLIDVKITRAGSFTLYGDPAIVSP
jgi:tRNA-2-methylthio-N6-dimethylallyladenosine synthase